MSRSFGGLHGYGYVSDPKGHMVCSSHVLLGANTVTPSSASLKDFVPCIFDQLTTSSCTGQAVSGAIATRMKRLDSLKEIPSASGIYKIGRMLDRSPLFDGELPPLTDDGAMPNQVMRGITEWGIPSIETEPFDPSTINDEPNMALLLDSGDCKLDGYYRINWTDLQRRVDALRLAVSSGYPVCFAVHVDPAFEEYKVGVIGAPDLSKDLGGHYMYVISYHTLASGLTVFEIVNSWGTAWGINGFGLVNEKFVAGMRDIYVMNVKVKA